MLWKSIRFVSDHQTHLSLFFSEVDLLVCFGSLSCWKPRCVCTNYTFFVKRSFRSSDSPRTSHHQKVRGPLGCCLAKERWAFHQNLHGLFLSNIKICQMIWNNSLWQISRKKNWDEQNICSQHCKQREKDRCWLSRKTEKREVRGRQDSPTCTPEFNPHLPQQP